MSISMGTSLRTNIHLQRSWSRSTAELLLSPVAFQDVSRLAGSLPKLSQCTKGSMVITRINSPLESLIGSPFASNDSSGQHRPAGRTFNSATPHCSMMIPRLAKGLEGHLDDLLGKFQFYFGSTHVAHVCKIKAVPYQKYQKNTINYRYHLGFLPPRVLATSSAALCGCHGKSFTSAFFPSERPLRVLW